MSARGDLRPAVVVTGASAGIGRAIARIAAREGSAIVLIARSSDGLQAVAEEVREAGAESFTLELNLLAEHAPARIERFLSEQGLFCDVLVNCAGYGLRGAANTLPVDEQMDIINLNIRALSDVTLRFLPGMAVRRRGGIINFSSVAGFTPGPYMAVYYASKAFVRSFSQALHEEVRHAGVTVTCVAPGPVRTEFLGVSGARQTILFRFLPALPPEVVAEKAWRSFRSRRRFVAPGLSSKLAILTARLFPSSMMLPLIAKLQRRGNDPCPCGSGKKFKKCHGAKRTSLQRGTTLKALSTGSSRDGSSSV
ncbi:SDR family NAD(P)-dependent oxidoreductase [Chelativorans salis]|uniref:SDR family NAD(P)-dependent oxidoreductase n=1 Tax=Chelativorans salis TaxID=2978478 RepID=A0ABT2LJE8_9HYPH|nr:SDR family NAD(P)-dependent oxidoreductase [Chelativorans sp. EGI FJ00035]MCT7374720.1 SDR family NAD(P)-dependent oxidoreductase [Chelativorans sp. EGI FJ00035]